MSEKKIKLLIAKVGCDIHERGALTLASVFRDAGMEVIYTGRYQSPRGVANAAICEDVDVIALSDHTGSLPIIAGGVIEELKKQGVDDIPIVAGGLLSAGDVRKLQEMGVTGNYGPGTGLETILDHVRSLVRGSSRAGG